jgi:hypothetical protein
MSNEEKNQNQEQTEQPSPKKEKEVTRGDRGELGTATAGLTIWQRWREAHFTRENANRKHNPNKRIYVRKPGAPSLKAFARALAKESDLVAEQWLRNKLGLKNQKRSDANIKAAMEARAATKAAKRKKKGEGGGK